MNRIGALAATVALCAGGLASQASAQTYTMAAGQLVGNDGASLRK